MDPFLNVTAPTRKSRVGGIRNVAEVEGDVFRIFAGGTVAYEAPQCGTALGDAALCFPTGGEAQQPKTYEGIDIFEGIAPADAFYAGVECYLGGAEYGPLAEAALEERIDLKIEKAVDDWVTAEDTAATATDFVDAVAQLENDADANYAGQPVLFMNRGDAVRARAQKAVFGDKEGNLWTINGSPVISSSSITVGRVAVTGSVKILESNTLATETIAQTTNREQAIAERAFAVVIDCKYLSAATVA